MMRYNQSKKQTKQNRTKPIKQSIYSKEVVNNSNSSNNDDNDNSH